MESNGLNQYLGVISPNSLVTSDAIEMKIRCKNEYSWDSAVYALPHLTVFDFIQPESNEERLTTSLERNMEKISPFQIDLHGFDYFYSNTYTLYMKVSEEKEFAEMAQYIRKSSKVILKTVQGYPPFYAKKAHLTIAKGILESEFMKAWDSWKDIEYKSSTIANYILLLKRPFGSIHSKYEIIGKYKFLGKGSFDTQLKLF